MTSDASDPYKTLFLGKEAYEVSKFSDRNVRTIIIHPVGSAGPDPLDQYGKISWKASVVTGILNQNTIPTVGPIQRDEIWEATQRWMKFFE